MGKVQLYFPTGSTASIMLNILDKLLNRSGKQDKKPTETPENDGSTEIFETPEMEEFLTENQTADEL